MVQTNDAHDKIINILREKGPSLPINIAKNIGMNSLFVSAYLSELADEKKIKISHLKVGGSPLYFLEGDEEKLEQYHNYLHPKESEAFLILKNNKLIKDSDQDPAIRVALRSIKDFAIGFKKNDEIYWRYSLTPEHKIHEILNQDNVKIKNQTIKNADNVPKKKQESISTTFQNPLIINENRGKKKKSEFVQKVINFLNSNNLKIIEELSFKAKEFNCKIQIRSELGLIEFLTQAKDKKTISETDLKKLLSESQKIPLPAFIIYTGMLSKKAKEYLKNYSSILKAKKIG